VALRRAGLAMRSIGTPNVGEARAFSRPLVLWAAAHMAFFILFAGLEVGLLRICLTLSVGGDPRYRVAFSGLALGLRLLAAQLIYFGLVVFGLALLGIPGVYLAARYSLFGFAVASGERNLMENETSSRPSRRVRR
jgi:hypothetical protein